MATGDLALGQEQGAISAQKRVVNDFSINVATVNGSGSQSANSVLLKSIFGMGIPVSGKNLFPSNIAGLPTWYTIRASKDGYVARTRDRRIPGGSESRDCEERHRSAARGRRGHLRRKPEPEAVSQRRCLLSGSFRQDHCGRLHRGQAAQAGQEHGVRGRGGAIAFDGPVGRREQRQKAIREKAEGIRSELWRGQGWLTNTRRRSWSSRIRSSSSG